MNIMIGINDNYIFPAKVMLTSLCENNKFEKHYVYVLYDVRNLNTRNIENLKSLEKQYDVEICPIEFNADIFEEFPMNLHFSVETYFRFMAQEMLPKSVERVLWLDADMVIIKNIKDFYYQDFENKLIAACRTNNKREKEFLINLDLDPDIGYFNAGIILFNLKSIREKICIRNFFECLQKYKEKIVWLDQDILNIVFAYDKKLIENQVYNFTFFSDTVFSPKDIDEINKNVYILHYIGGEKPWNLSYKNSLIKYFRKYARKQETVKETILFEMKYLYNRIYVKILKK